MFYSIDLNEIIMQAASTGEIAPLLRAALEMFKDGEDRENITNDLRDVLLDNMDLETWRGMSDAACSRAAHPLIMAWIEGEDDIFGAMTNCLDIEESYSMLAIARDEIGCQISNGDPLLSFVLRYIEVHLNFVRWCVGENVKDVRDEDVQWTLYRQDLDRSVSALAMFLTDHTLNMML